MKLKENRVMDDDLHNDLISTRMWGDLEDGELVGVLPLGECFSEDGVNVCIYHIGLGEIIDGFIELHHNVGDGMIVGEDAEKALAIIASMEREISKLKGRIGGAA